MRTTIRDHAPLPASHEGDPYVPSAALGAAIAEREPRRAALPARAAAADRRRVDLGREARDDTRGSGLLERGGPLDRDAADARVLQREPAQDACGSLQPALPPRASRRAAARVEQEGEQRALRRSPATASASVASSSALSSSTGALISFQVSSSESRRLRSRSRRWTAASRPRIGPSDSTASQPSWAHCARRDAVPRARARRRGRAGRRRRGRRAAA